jgi:hypothetical protein
MNRHEASARPGARAARQPHFARSRGSPGLRLRRGQQAEGSR